MRICFKLQRFSDPGTAIVGPNKKDFRQKDPGNNNNGNSGNNNNNGNNGNNNSNGNNNQSSIITQLSDDRPVKGRYSKTGGTVPSSSGNDSIVGTGNSMTIATGSGNDTIEIGTGSSVTGSNYVDAGKGDDIITLNRLGVVVVAPEMTPFTRRVLKVIFMSSLNVREMILSLDSIATILLKLMLSILSLFRTMIESSELALILCVSLMPKVLISL